MATKIGVPYVAYEVLHVYAEFSRTANEFGVNLPAFVCPRTIKVTQAAVRPEDVSADDDPVDVSRYTVSMWLGTGYIKAQVVSKYSPAYCRVGWIVEEILVRWSELEKNHPHEVRMESRITKRIINGVQGGNLLNPEGIREKLETVRPRQRHSDSEVTKSPSTEVDDEGRETSPRPVRVRKVTTT